MNRKFQSVVEFHDFANTLNRSMITNSGKFFAWSISENISLTIESSAIGGIMFPTYASIEDARSFLQKKYEEDSYQFRGVAYQHVLGDMRRANREYSEFLDKLEDMIDPSKYNQEEASGEKQQETPTDSYLILQEYYPNTLAQSVNARLEEGWTCLGGVAVGQYMGNMMLYQSMIKVKNEICYRRNFNLLAVCMFFSGFRHQSAISGWLFENKHHGVCILRMFQR